MGGKKTPPERGSGESREAYTGLRLLINPKPIKPTPRRARETGSGVAATPASPFTAKRARSIPPSSHSDPFQKKYVGNPISISTDGMSPEPVAPNSPEPKITA